MFLDLLHSLSKSNASASVRRTADNKMAQRYSKAHLVDGTHKRALILLVELLYLGDYIRSLFRVDADG